MGKDTRLAAANLLLERGVRFKVDAPSYQRLLGLNRITIRPLYPGTIAAFSILVIESGLEDATRLTAAANMESICKIIAIAVLNDEAKIIKKTDALAKKLQWNVPANQLIEIFMHLANINNVLDFTIITNYFSTMTNQMMSTKNLGQ